MAEHRLYLIEHLGLRLRKIGITSGASRLNKWDTRGWSLVETRIYDTFTGARTTEWYALRALDQRGARSSDRMKAIFANLDRDGRTEMFDPDVYDAGLGPLVDDFDRLAFVPSEFPPPPWIAERRREAALKATSGRDNSAAARKAWITRRLRSNRG